MVTFDNREAIITRFDISIESKQTSQKNKVRHFAVFHDNLNQKQKGHLQKM